MMCAASGPLEARFSEAFRSRPLGHVAFPCVFADAAYIKTTVPRPAITSATGPGPTVISRPGF